MLLSFPLTILPNKMERQSLAKNVHPLQTRGIPGMTQFYYPKNSIS